MISGKSTRSPAAAIVAGVLFLIYSVAFRSQRQFPSLAIRIVGAIGGTATVAGDLPNHRGNGSIQMSGDLTERRTGGDPSRDVFSLTECKC